MVVNANCVRAPALVCVCVCVCVWCGVCVCVCFFFLLSLFVTLYIFLHLTVMHSSTFEMGWVGMSACPLVVLAARAYMYVLCVFGAVNTQGFVYKFFMRYI